MNLQKKTHQRLDRRFGGVFLHAVFMRNVFFRFHLKQQMPVSQRFLRVFFNLRMLIALVKNSLKF